MASMRIAESTGEIDRRCLNGNNSVKRGKDKKKRKKKEERLKPEVVAGLKARLDILLDYFGGTAAMAATLGVSREVVYGWVKRGRISAHGASMVQLDYRRNGCAGYRASFCRPDLKFDKNGKLLESSCKRKVLLKK